MSVTQMALPLSPEATAVLVTAPRLRPGDRIDRSGVLYELVERETNRKKFIRTDTSMPVWLTNEELVSMMARCEVTVALPEWLPAKRAKKWRQDFNSMQEHEKELARMRLAYVEAVLENRHRGYPLKVQDVLDLTYQKRLQNPKAVEFDEHKPSKTAVYEWLALWEKENGPRGIKRLCFAESERGARGVQMHESIAPILHDAIRELWYSPQRTRVRHIFDRVIADAAKAGIPENQRPSARTIRRALEQLPPYAVAKARKGLRKAEEDYRSKGQLPPTPLPGQVYEIDAHKLDWLAVDDRFGMLLGRLWITAVIDRCTRVVVGFHIHVEPPSSLTVAAALRNALAPKLYMLKKWPEIGRPWVAWGVPELVILDNGLENHAVFLQEAFEELGIEWYYAPPRTPETKPHIERWFGTLTGDFSALVPGWVGNHPRAKGDYDSSGLACITLANADELMHRWVVAYNMTYHQGLRDIPERLWLELTAEHGVAPIDDVGMLDIILGEYAVRTPTNKGIHLMGLRFGDLGENRPLELIRTRAGAANLGKVRIRFDRSNLSRIWVQDPLTKEYHSVASLDPEYTTGLTLAQHRMIRRFAVERAKGYVSIAELCTARAEILRRIQEMCGDEGVSARRAVAMYNGLGSKGSWGDYYRMAEAEYGRNREENLRLSVARLLEADVDDVVDPVGTTTPAPPAQAAGAPAAANESTATPTPAPDPLADRHPVTPVASATGTDDAEAKRAALRKRMTDMGMDVEGL